MHFLGLFKLCQRLLLFLPLTTASAAETAAAHKNAFHYDNSNNWYLDYPECGGDKQSPIIIKTNKTLEVSIPPITFGSYDVFFSNYAVLKNNGHSIKFNVPDTIEFIRPFITDGPLNGLYEAIEVHFHWGSPLCKGSEHQINQRRYDLEMHIVHLNTKYGSVEEAREYDDGIAVIGAFFKVEKTALPTFHPGLDTVFNTVPFVLLYNSSATTNQLFTLGSMLANINRDNFYTYQGSLTTPPCSQAVTWIVYPEVIPIPLFQLQNFWFVRDDRGRKLLNNFRPVQPLGAREVYHRSADEYY